MIKLGETSLAGLIVENMTFFLAFDFYFFLFSDLELVADEDKGGEERDDS